LRFREAIEKNRQIEVANTILSQRGPALLLCFTVVLGLFYDVSELGGWKGY
jgi:hypothetical protein